MRSTKANAAIVSLYWTAEDTDIASTDPLFFFLVTLCWRVRSYLINDVSVEVNYLIVHRQN